MKKKGIALKWVARWPEMEIMLQNGATKAELGRKYGVTTERIRQVINLLRWRGSEKPQ